jgi:hypothetical protein
MDFNQPVGNFAILARLHDRISGLTENEQIALLKNILPGKLTPYLYKLIIDLSHERKLQLLNQLRGMVTDAPAGYTIDLEERNTPRKKCSIDVDMATPDQTFRYVILDISTGGMFIKADEFLNVGQKLSLNFSYPGAGNVSGLPAEIVRQSPNGVGVKFSGLTPLHRQQLKTLVYNIDTN